MSNKEYFIFTVVGPMLSCLIGMWFGAKYFADGIGEKEYPIQVETFYTASHNSYMDVIECDSIKGDTIYKDGRSIVNKNISNVVFK